MKKLLLVALATLSLNVFAGNIFYCETEAMNENNDSKFRLEINLTSTYSDGLKLKFSSLGKVYNYGNYYGKAKEIGLVEVDGIKMVAYQMDLKNSSGVRTAAIQFAFDKNNLIEDTSIQFVIIRNGKVAGTKLFDAFCEFDLI